MDSDPTEIEALLRIATALVIGVDSAMDRLLSLLPRCHEPNLEDRKQILLLSKRLVEREYQTWEKKKNKRSSLADKVLCVR
jgi:hypothetical protein